MLEQRPCYVNCRSNQQSAISYQLSAVSFQPESEAALRVSETTISVWLNADC
jgi:hypothetical protein